jgi:hypothetical protein
LAEVHRKGGDVARALELLRAGLELHPNYIPASIVLGRCHWDLGDLPAAESAFAHVLRLDDENVIALKSLADINERLERFTEAQRWLQRLVSIDRSNEEARQQLARLESAKERGDRKAESAPASSAAPELPQEIIVAKPVQPETKTPKIPAALSSAAAPPERTPSEMAPLDLTADIAEAVSPPTSDTGVREAAETKSPALEFLDTSEPARARGAESPGSHAPVDEPAPVDGLISQEFVPPKEATYRLHPELTQEFVSARESPERVDVELTEEVELNSSGAAEFRVPNAAEDFMELAARMNAARQDTPIVGSAGPPLAPEPPAAEAPPTDLAPLPQPQGDRRKAAPPQAEAPAAAQSYAARDTNGQSVGSFFKALLAARPSGNSGHPASGSSASVEGAAPPDSARDAPSLTGLRAKEESAHPPETAASGKTRDAAVSFDDFFGSSAGGASPLPQEGDPNNDDLDQFQSWLQNLKR